MCVIQIYPSLLAANTEIEPDRIIVFTPTYSRKASVNNCTLIQQILIETQISCWPDLRGRHPHLQQFLSYCPRISVVDACFNPAPYISSDNLYTFYALSTRP